MSNNASGCADAIDSIHEIYNEYKSRLDTYTSAHREWKRQDDEWVTKSNAIQQKWEQNRLMKEGKRRTGCDRGLTSFESNQTKCTRDFPGYSATDSGPCNLIPDKCDYGLFKVAGSPCGCGVAEWDCKWVECTPPDSYYDAQMRLELATLPPRPIEPREPGGPVFENVVCQDCRQSIDLTGKNYASQLNQIITCIQDVTATKTNDAPPATPPTPPATPPTPSTPPTPPAPMTTYDPSQYKNNDESSNKIKLLIIGLIVFLLVVLLFIILLSS